MKDKGHIMSRIGITLVALAVIFGAFAALAGTTSQPLAGSGVQMSSQATSPIASGKAGVWQSSDQPYFQNSSNLQALMAPACILNPAAQQTGSINVSGNVEADTSFIGPQWSTFTGLSQTTIDDTNGFQFHQFPNFTSASDTYLIVDRSTPFSIQLVTNGGLTNTYIAAFSGISAANSRLLQLTGGTQNDIYVATSFGQFNQYCMLAETATTTVPGVTLAEVAVWAGSKNVERAAATANLHTVAGVAITTNGGGGPATICKVGRVIVNADAGIVAGDILVTSGAVAGNVAANNAAPVGAKIGRAIEATGGTVAGQVLMDVEL